MSALMFLAYIFAMTVPKAFGIEVYKDYDVLSILSKYVRNFCHVLSKISLNTILLILFKIYSNYNLNLMFNSL